MNNGVHITLTEQQCDEIYIILLEKISNMEKVKNQINGNYLPYTKLVYQQKLTMLENELLPLFKTQE